MTSQEISKYEYIQLSIKIEKHNEIQSALKEAYELTKSVKEERDKSKNNPSKYNELDNMLNSFIKEYKDLETEIKKAINGDNKISEIEKSKIMYELGDIIQLAEVGGIKESKNLWSKVGDKLRSTNTDKVKNEAMGLNQKKELITKYFKKENISEIELKKLLTISNEDRKKLGEYSTGNTAGKVASLFGLDSSSADIFLSQEEVIRTNQFQDDIIKKIGLEKGYNNSGDIHAYHSSMGNYITNVPIVENVLKTRNVQELGNKALKNYIGFLESKGELTPKNLKIKFGEEKSNEIFDFIKRNNPDKITGEKFSDDFVNKITKIVDDALNFLKEKINGLFIKLNKSKNIEEFKNNLEEIKNYDKDEKAELLKKFDIEIKKKESALKKLFFEPIKAKLIKDGKTEAEANKEASEITDKTLNQIGLNLSVSNGDKVFDIIQKFNTDYPDAKLSIKKTAELAAETSSLDSERKALEETKLADEAIKKGDNVSARKHEQNAQSNMIRAGDAKTFGKMIKQTTEQEAIDIGTGKLNYEKHLEKIYERDPSLKKEIDELNKEKKELEDQNKKNEDTNKNLKTETESKQTNIETGSYKYDTGSGVIEIALDNGNEKIELSPSERVLAKNNPESIKNIVDFFKILNELGLSELWKEKEKIFTSISNKYGIGFNTKSGYLSENETKVFLNSILKSVGQEEINQTTSLTEFKNIFSNKNDLQIIGSGYKDNLLQKGSSKISEQFLQKYVIGKPYFDIEGFSKNI